jgi:hypothetical protein
LDFDEKDRLVVGCGDEDAIKPKRFLFDFSRGELLSFCFCDRAIN